MILYIYLCEYECVWLSLTSGQTPSDNADTCVLVHYESKDVHYSCPYAATNRNNETSEEHKYTVVTQ